ARMEGDEEETAVGADARGGQIWAGNKGSATLTQLQPPTMARIHGVAPGGVAVVGTPRGDDIVWASDTKQNVIVRIDSASARIVRRIPLAGHPSRIAADAHTVWVADRGYGGRQWAPTSPPEPAPRRPDPPRRRATPTRLPPP